MYYYHNYPYDVRTYENAYHRQNLAPHETLELHELLASKTGSLYNMKKTLPKITDPELREIYKEAIQLNSSHIRQLVGLLQDRAYVQEGNEYYA